MLRFELTVYRYSNPHQGHAQTRRKGHQTGHDHGNYNLRMHSLSTPRRHLQNPQHSPKDPRRNDLSTNDQFSESEPRSSIGGYHHSAQRRVDEARCSCSCYDYMVRRTGRSRISFERRRRGSCANGSCGWCCTERSRTYDGSQMIGVRYKGLAYSPGVQGVGWESSIDLCGISQGRHRSGMKNEKDVMTSTPPLHVFAACRSRNAQGCLVCFFLPTHSHVAFLQNPRRRRAVCFCYHSTRRVACDFGHFSHSYILFSFSMLTVHLPAECHHCISLQTIHVLIIRS